MVEWWWQMMTDGISLDTGVWSGAQFFFPTNLGKSETPWRSWRWTDNKIFQRLNSGAGPTPSPGPKCCYRSIFAGNLQSVKGQHGPSMCQKEGHMWYFSATATLSKWTYNEQSKPKHLSLFAAVSGFVWWGTVDRNDSIFSHMGILPSATRQ